MHASTATAGHELYLVLREVSSRLPSLLAELHPLSQAPEAAMLTGVDALYQQVPDLALLCLRFDESVLDAKDQVQLIKLATSAGISVLDPKRLNAKDHTLFYERYLRRYAIHIDDHRSPHAALHSLGQLLGLISVRASSERDITVSDEDDSYLLDANADEEALTRVDDGSRQRAEDMLDIDLPVTKSPPAKSPAPALEMDLGPAGRGPQARGKAKRSERLATIPARPANARSSSPHHDLKVLDLPLPPPVNRRPARDAPIKLVAVQAAVAAAPVRDKVATSAPPVRARMSSPPPFALAHEEIQSQVRARFQRGDTWMPARLRNLTTKEVRLAASAAPGLGQKLNVSVTLGEHSTLVRGTVVEVINTERSVDGSTTFRLEFDELAIAERDKLVLLLRMAQRQGVSLSPPPPRRNRRFAISWPVAVVSDGHRFNAAALDISKRGLFLATTTLINANRLVFGIPLDRAKARVQGRARIARQVSAEMAERLGLRPGYGLQIEDLSTEDKALFNHFLVRVGKRSQKHILVVGDAERSQSLAECFHAAGYAVSKAQSVEHLRKRTDIESGGLTMAVIDQHSLSLESRKQFVEDLQMHQVPILRLDGQTPHLARDALDKAVQV